MQLDVRGGANAIRAFALMQIGLGLAQDRSDPARPYRDVRVSLGAGEGGAWEQRLVFSTGSPELALSVARGEIDLAAINPSAYLTMAYRGTGPFPAPLGLRAIAVMPSWDRMAFAVAERTGLVTLSDIRDRRYPLRVSIRRSEAHATRFVADQVLQAEGLSLKDIEAWGGTFHYVDTPSEASRLEGIRSGAIDAVFDEGIKGWGPLALEHGMRFLPLGEEARRELESLGWPARPIPPSRFPRLGGEVLAPSFSGWPIFTHAALPDDVAYRICRALDSARPQIPWDADEPVQLADLCRATDATDLDVPLHPGAERYYREQGALE